jgi:hypothetical protein
MQRGIKSEPGRYTALLIMVGYDPAHAPNQVQMTTGSGAAHVPCLSVNRINALGHDRV